MAYKLKCNCRKYSLLIGFLLLLQTGYTQNSFSKIDAWMKNNLKDLGGRAVVVLYKDGKMVYNHAENNLTAGQKFVGKKVAKKQGKDPDVVLEDFTSVTRQRIASCSKWLSAALVMTFVDEGKLAIDDTIGKFLPVMTENGKGNITIWQCLSHLTGIKPVSIKDEVGEITKAGSMDEAMKHIASLPMEGKPGQTFHYSSAGLQIAAAIIEKISGKDFETLFQQRIAKPCGMINTDFGKGKVPLAAGGAQSTAEDYLHFLEMILNKGVYNGKRVLSAESTQAMQLNRIGRNCNIVYTPAEAGNWGYGFGEWVMPGEIGTVTSPGLFGSFPWVDNNRQYAGFLFTFGFKTKGRQERYIELKRLADEAIAK